MTRLRGAEFSMRFVFISTMDGSPWGGSEELWSQAATRLKRAGHDVHASVEYWPQLSGKVLSLMQDGVRIETHSTYRVPRARRIWNQLSLSDRRRCNRLKRLRPDLVVISQGDNAGGFGWAKACREAAIPYVIVIQCNAPFLWFGEPLLSEATASYRNARRIFCVSRGNLDLLRLQLGEPLPNGDVIYNPYNVSTERPPAWPDEREGWRLACVARMDLAAKGQDLLLQTLARPEWRERPLELNLFGNGLHETLLRRLSEMFQLKNVHLRGHVNDVRAIWEQNHMLVLPSRYEGMPLALVEAMWCGRPAIVTGAGGNAELCLDNETGFVAPAPTVGLINQTLERAWERRNEWMHLGQAARKRAESLIPKDPIALFCERLNACVAATSGEVPAAEVLAMGR